jgi:anaerobic selenocysteine-containing dehydrogenase
MGVACEDRGMEPQEASAVEATGSVESRQVLAACNLCEAICGLVLTVEDRPGGPHVTSIRGNEDDPLSRGHICPKGVALADVYEDPDRLRRPVRRVGEGANAQWVEISWDEALDRTADGIAAAVNRGGRDALGVYLGNPNAHSLGAKTHGVQMIKTFKTHNKFSASSVDQVPHQFVAWQLFGHQLLIPIADMDRTSYFLVFGANPMASNGSLMTVPDFPQRLRELRRRGGRMVVLDPRRTETAKVADEHHFVRPATDAVVLLAMLHVLFEEELTDPPAYVAGIESVRLAVADFTPEYAAQASGVPAGVIRRIARELAAADGAAAYGRIGLSTQGFGSICQWAIQCLNILTGNFDREGGVLFTEPAVDIVGKAIVGRGHHDAWRSRVRGVPEFAGELPVSVLREEIETPGEGQIRAVLTIAGNPVLSTPDGRHLGEALAGLDFMAAVDIYLNETTRHADVVLPPTTALEREQYDLVFHTLAVRNTARFTPPVFEKPKDAMHDWEIFREIALRTNARLDRKKPMAKLLTERVSLSVSPSALVTTLLLTGRRTTMRALRSHPEGVDLGPLRPTMPGRLQTKDKLIHLAPDLILADLGRLRRTTDAQIEAGPAEGDLVLIGRRHQRDNNSWMHNSERLTRGKPRHQLLMNPDDLAARGLTDGARVRVASRVGEVVTEVRGTDDMMPGVVSLPHGYGHDAQGMRLSRASKVVGVSINDLTDPERLDVSGNAALNGVPVTVTAT